MTPLPARSPRRPPRGGVSWVTLLLLGAAVAVVYLVIAWGPIYVIHYEVKQVVRDYMNQAIKNRNDQELVERMCQKLASLDTMVETDANGAERRVPVVQVSPSDVLWERDTNSTPPMLHVAFEYVREVRYPYMEQVSEWVGTVDLYNDLTIPNWGPAR